VLASRYLQCPSRRRLDPGRRRKTGKTCNAFQSAPDFEFVAARHSARRHDRFPVGRPHFTTCEVSAERDFAMAIHLPTMDAFDAYATQMMALAADWDAGRIGSKQMAAGATSIRNEYWFACNCGLRDRRDRGSLSYDIIPSATPTPP